MQMCNRARSAYENTATRATHAADIANKWTSDAWHKMNSARPSTRPPTDSRPSDTVTKYQKSPKVPSPNRNKMNEFYKKARQRANDTADTASLVASGTVKAARLGAAAGEAWLENFADEVWKGRGGKLNKKTRKRNKRKTRKKKFRKKRSLIKNRQSKKR